MKPVPYEVADGLVLSGRPSKLTVQVHIPQTDSLLNLACVSALLHRSCFRDVTVPLVPSIPPPRSAVPSSLPVRSPSLSASSYLLKAASILLYAVEKIGYKTVKVIRACRLGNGTQNTHTDAGRICCRPDYRIT
jgi:hypothetical protein